MTCQPSSLLDCCLFFTANSLARVVTRMGEEEFARTGLSPSSAFLLSLAAEQPGVSQKELAESLHLAPSTVSRMVDALARRGLVAKESRGRNTYVTPTQAGLDMLPAVQEAWKSLYRRYSAVLGEEAGQELTRLTREAYRALDE
jgi:DNA-binding MarR family transcriptional regulator